MTRMLVAPAFEELENSVDVFDADRKNSFGGLYCVAAVILLSQVEQAWDQYAEYRAEELAGGIDLE